MSLVPWGVPDRQSCGMLPRKDTQVLGRQTDVCMGGRLLLPANTSWSQTGSAGDFVVQFELLKGLAVFIGRAVCVCTPLNALQSCPLTSSLGALIITKQEGEG